MPLKISSDSEKLKVFNIVRKSSYFMVIQVVAKPTNYIK